jgi:glucose/arabinose dehydrogenase/PKD repeat protein
MLLPPDFTSEVVVDGVFGPTDFVFSPDGRIVVARKGGQVQTFLDGVQEPGDLIDLGDEVSNFGDRGLLALALHPGFTPDGGPNSWIYLYYTYDPVPGTDGPNGSFEEAAMGRLTRYRVVEQVVQGTPSLRADPASRQILLGERLPDGRMPTGVPSLGESHNGGSLVWGSDGSLLLSTGDGTDASVTDLGGLQPWGFDDFVNPVTGLVGPVAREEDSGMFRSQDLRSLAGKVLRIDPETGLGLPSNPFYDGDPDSRTSRVWALGLRNAFRMERVPGSGASDPSLGDPGTFVVADVGTSRWEEVNVVQVGQNFGWPCFEHTEPLGAQGHSWGANPFNKPTCATLVGTPLTAALAYRRDDPLNYFPPGTHQSVDGVPLDGLIGISITGGTFYEGGSYPPAYHGRYFFSDFGLSWIKAAAFDSGLAVTEFSTFAENAVRPVAFRTDPVSGDLHVLEFGLGAVVPGRITAVRYLGPAAPVASFTATPGTGPFELQVAFDASASQTPLGTTLSYAWNFGDGSPTASGVQVQHTYAAPGVYPVQLTVMSSDGQSAALVQPLLVGEPLGAVAILSPPQGALFEPGEPVQLAGFGLGNSGQTLGLTWRVDQFLNGQATLNVFVGTGPEILLPFPVTPSEADFHYYRVRLIGTSPGNPNVGAQVFIFPKSRYRDLTGTSLPIAKVFELDPPGSQGFGNPDVEVWRDLGPQPGSGGLLDQFTTFHPQNSGTDWVGYALPPGSDPQTLITAVELVGGLMVPEGGWFTKPRIQVRVGGQWVPANNVVLTPPYPVGAPPEDFARTFFTFDPALADAVRVSGVPGGSIGFLSVAELRVYGVAPPEPLRDITDLAVAPLSHLLQLDPPGPQRFGSLDLGRLGDGAEPAAGSTSLAAQVASYHSAAVPGSEHWFGWRFDDAHTLTALRFREGLVWSAGGDSAGGWFQDLRVETRLGPTDPWVPVSGLASSPPYRTVGPGTPDYEAYTFAFDPVVAREVRLIGKPGGSLAFASASELRVFEPQGFDGGWQSLPGLGLPADRLTLLEPGGPPGIGLPILLETVGAEPSVPGVLALAPNGAVIALGLGTLLVDPTGAILLPYPFNGAGQARAQLVLPVEPALVGIDIYFQSLALAPNGPGGIDFSSGLRALLSQP